MSAAEKLRALEQALADPDLRWGRGALASLHDALPQIVAVVEAAEAFRPNEGTTSYEGHPRVILGRALSALDEALGDVT